jgi:hypothetical protein
MKTYLIKLTDDSLHLVRSSQFPKRADYAEVLEAPKEAESAEDLDVVVEEDREMRNVQAVDDQGNPIFEEREIEYIDEETGEPVKETIRVPVWELDADGNPVQEEVIVDTRTVVKINETKRQERLDREAQRAAQEAEREEQRRQRLAERETKFKELNAKPVLTNPEIQEAVKLFLEERAERIADVADA